MLQHPFTGLVTGGTGSGKSTLVKELILGNKIDPSPDEIYWLYGQHQPELERALSPRVKFIQGIPDDLEDLIQRPCRTLVLIDDLMTEIGDNERISKLYTQGSHHTDTSVLTLLQNLYHKGKVMRTINLNSHYLILFRNARDASQVRCLASQVFPGQGGVMMDAYKRCTDQPFGYLMLDLHPRTDASRRLVSDLLDDCPTVWVAR